MNVNENSVIEVSRLTKKYKRFELKDVTMDVKQGFITGLIGANGAGKSTLIKLAMAFAALYYPIQFWLGVRNSSFISFLVIFLAAALIGGIGNMADSLTFDMLPTRAQLVIGLPIAGLLLLYVSYRISLNLFLRKDIEG